MAETARVKGVPVPPAPLGAAKGALLLRGVRLLDPARRLDQVGDLLMVEGRIAACGQVDPAAVPPGCAVVEGHGLAAAPGFTDLHCHLREPGQEDKETIATGTRAAARGGFTTVCAMPNTIPPVDNAAVVEFVLRKAALEGVVRLLPVGCVSKRREGRELAELGDMVGAGAVAFSDDGSPVADAGLMRLALLYARAFGVPVINHCEEPALSRGGVMHEGWVATRLGLRGIPAAAEESMVARDIALAEATGGHVHIAHVSTARAVELVREAKARGVRVTAEATPHHLTLTDEWAAGFRDGGPAYRPLTPQAYDTFTKVYPPLRSRHDVEAVVAGLADGTLDCVATDHAPHEWTTKAVTYDDASNGISVLETAFGSLMALVRGGRLTLLELVERLTVGPWRVLAGGEVGEVPPLATLAPGTPADVVLFDPDAEWVVEPERFASKGRNTPLGGVTLRGRVMATLVEGRTVYTDERVGLPTAQ